MEHLQSIFLSSIELGSLFKGNRNENKRDILCVLLLTTTSLYGNNLTTSDS